MNRLVFTLLLVVCFQSIFATDYYVSTSGSDASGNGSQASPWRSLRVACTKVAANQGHTIRVSAGTFLETQIAVPTGVNIIGAGKDQTILKADPSFYYNPASPGYATNKYLLFLNSNSLSNGNQSLKDFTVDGDGKKLHGGIWVKFRTNVLIQRVKIQYTNFNGIWLWDVKDSRLTEVDLKNCSWGSSAWASGALNLATLERVEVDHITIDESVGYGIKAIGSTNGQMHYLKVHDSRISVNPFGQWTTSSGASAPNIAFELWNVDMVGCELYNNYIDNILSLVMDAPQWDYPKGSSAIRVYNNTFDMETRAAGNGYSIELTMHDAEIDHNYFLKGKHGIANWDSKSHKMSNWNIHHNTFYGLTDSYPADILRVQSAGLNNVKFSNNTVEFIGTKTCNLIALYGGASANVELKNNLVINSNTAYNHYPNKFIHLENGTMSNLQVSNNFLVNQPIGSVPGTYSGNITTGDPKIAKTGSRPAPYYVPQAGSPLIDAGLNLGLAFTGTKPDIGAYESTGAAAVAVTGVTISPATVTLAVNATSQLSKTISPANATNQNVTWISSNTSVATVNSAGLITAIAAGTTTITATTADGGKTATSAVTVTSQSIAVTGVTLTPATISLAPNGTAQLTATVSPANATNKNLTWTSNNTNVATVSSAGLVTGKAAGTAVVTATTTDGNKIATSQVTVNSSQALTTDLDDATMGTTTNQFNYVGSGWAHGTTTVHPYFQNTVSYSNVSSNSVTVPFSGSKIELYTAKDVHHGIAAISIDNGPETFVDLYAAARQNYVSVYNSILTDGNHTIKIRVTGTKNASGTGTYVVLDYMKVYAGGAVAVTGVTVSPATVSLAPGSTYQLSAAVSPSTATNKNVTWSSSNTAFATVNATGLVTAVAAGTATITVKSVDGNKISSSVVTIAAPVTQVTGVAVAPATLSVAIGSTSQLTATCSPSTATNKNVTWTSSNNSIATVSSAGIVTGVTTGNVAITATTTDGAKTSSANVAVVVPVSGVSLNPTNVSLNIGGTATLQAVVSPANATNKNVQWNSSNTTIATVSNGIITAASAGTAIITVTTADGNKTATATINVGASQTFADLDDATLGAAINQFNYSGSGWTHGTTTQHSYYQNTVSYSNVTSNSATVSFSGSKVEMITAKDTHHGIVAVSVDNGPETLVDLYSATRQENVSVYNKVLTEGSHTIKMRVTGTKNQASSGLYAVLDYLKVFSSQPTTVVATQAAIAPAIAEGEAGEIQIYPNPVEAGDILHVKLAQADGQVSVIDVTGFVHYKTVVTGENMEIPTSNMPKGMYFVQHRIGNNQQQYKILVD